MQESCPGLSRTHPPPFYMAACMGDLSTLITIHTYRPNPRIHLPVAWTCNWDWTCVCQHHKTALIQASIHQHSQIIFYILQTYPPGVDQSTTTTTNYTHITNRQDTTPHKGWTALHYAAYLSNQTIVEILLAHGADRNIKGISDQNTPLHLAAQEGYTHILRLLLSTTTNTTALDINARNGKENTALMIASQHGHIECVRLLLDYGANTELWNKDGRTALFLACKHVHTQVAFMIITSISSADHPTGSLDSWINRKDCRGDTCVTVSAANANRNTLVNANTIATTHGMTTTSTGAHLLHTLVQNYQGDLYARNNQGMNAIDIFKKYQKSNHYFDTLFSNSVARGEDDKYVALYDKFKDLIDVNWENSNIVQHNTALIRASFYGRYNAVKWLLEHTNANAEVNKKVRFAYTALMNAAETGQEDIIKLLIQYGARLHDVDTDKGWNALMWAAANGHDSTVTLLLGYGARADVQDKAGKTAMVHAIDKGYMNVLLVLIEHGASLDVLDYNGNGVLHAACRTGNETMVDILLARVANDQLSLQNECGDTPLIFAVRNGHEKVLRALLDRDVDMDLKDEDGFSALMYAMRARKFLFARLLLDKGANVYARRYVDGKNMVQMVSRSDAAEKKRLIVSVEARIEPWEHISMMA